MFRPANFDTSQTFQDFFRVSLGIFVIVCLSELLDIFGRVDCCTLLVDSPDLIGVATLIGLFVNRFFIVYYLYN